MSDQPRSVPAVRLDPLEAAEFVDMLAFIGDWLGGPDAAELAASLARFVGTGGYTLAELQADLARLAFLLGDDGERLFGHPE